MPHTKNTWTAAPSPNAVFSLARFENLAVQYNDYVDDMSVVSGSVIVASNTSKYKVGADYVCDGTNDDVQIQAAIDDCAEVGGGTVQLLEGTYYINTIIRLKNNVNIVGLGPKTSVGRMWAPWTDPVMTNDDTENGNYGIMLRDFWINYGQIYLENCRSFPYISIQKILFTSGNCDCIIAHECGHLRIDGCTTAYSGGGNWSFYDCEFVSIINSAFLNRPYITFDGCRDCLIRGCIITSDNVGIGVYRSNHCMVIGNTITRVASDYIDSPLGVGSNIQTLIMGNVISEFHGAGGIYLTNSDEGALIIGNNIYNGKNDGTGNTGHGIYAMFFCGHANISGNSVHNNYNGGIETGDYPNYTVKYGCVNDNYVYKNGLHGIRLTGITHTISAGNTTSWNSQKTHNTSSGITLGMQSVETWDNLLIGNLSYKGDSSPQQKYGINIQGDVGVSTYYNMVTMNYLKDGGATGALYDSGTNATDLKNWMTAGNKRTPCTIDLEIDDTYVTTSEPVHMIARLYTDTSRTLRLARKTIKIWHSVGGWDTTPITDKEAKTDALGQVYFDTQFSSYNNYYFRAEFAGDAGCDAPSTSTGIVYCAAGY